MEYYDLGMLKGEISKLRWYLGIDRWDCSRLGMETAIYMQDNNFRTSWWDSWRLGEVFSTNWRGSFRSQYWCSGRVCKYIWCVASAPVQDSVRWSVTLGKKSDHAVAVMKYQRSFNSTSLPYKTWQRVGLEKPGFSMPLHFHTSPSNVWVHKLVMTVLLEFITATLFSAEVFSYIDSLLSYIRPRCQVLYHQGAPQVSWLKSEGSW